MSEVQESASFAVPAAKLWGLVSNFGGVAEIMEGIDDCIVEGEGVGATRSFPMAGGRVVERLDLLDHDNMTLTYSIIEGAVPFTDYSATMVVSASGDDECQLVWTGQIEPKGVPADTAQKIASGIYRGGIASYRKALGLEA